MLAKTSIFLYLVLVPFMVTAQYRTEVGNPYTYIDSEIKRYFYQDGEILSVKVSKNGSVYLQKFNAGTLENTSARVYHGLPSTFKVEGILKFNNRYHFFYSSHEDGKNILNYWEIDFSIGDLIGKSSRLISIAGSMENFPQPAKALSTIRHKFNIVLSSDSMLIAVQYQLHHEKGTKNKGALGIHVFNKDLSEVWTKTLSIPYPRKKIKSIDCFLDARGTIFLITRVSKQNQTKQIQLLIFKVKDSEISPQINVPLFDKSPHSIHLLENNAGEIMGLGFYTSVRKRNNKNPSTDGIFTFSLPGIGDPKGLHTYEIPAHILTMNKSRNEIHKIARKEAQDAAEFENLVLEHIELLKTGSIIILGEQRYLLSSTRPPKELNNKIGSSTNFNFHNRDILVTKISENDSLQWMRKITRHQVHDAHHNKVGFTYVPGRTGYNFFYTDDKNNLKLGPTDVPAKIDIGDGRYLIHSRVDKETGEITKTVVLDSHNVKGMEITEITPQQMIVTASDVVVFEVKTNRKDLLFNKEENVLVKIDLQGY